MNWACAKCGSPLQYVDVDIWSHQYNLYCSVPEPVETFDCVSCGKKVFFPHGWDYWLHVGTNLAWCHRELQMSRATPAPAEEKPPQDPVDSRAWQ